MPFFPSVDLRIYLVFAVPYRPYPDRDRDAHRKAGVMLSIALPPTYFQAGATSMAPTGG